MLRCFLTAVILASGSMAVQAQAAPVALHYDVLGFTDNTEGDDGTIEISFDLYYDPTLTGSITANGGLVTNGHASYIARTGLFPSTGGMLTSLSASVGSPFNPYSYRPGTNDLTFSGSYGSIFYSTGFEIDSNGFSEGLNYNYDTSVSNGKQGTYAEGTFPGTSAVPEAASWAMMIIGLAGIGAVLRSTRRRSRNYRLAHV